MMSIKLGPKNHLISYVYYGWIYKANPNLYKRVKELHTKYKMEKCNRLELDSIIYKQLSHGDQKKIDEIALANKAFDDTTYYYACFAIGLITQLITIGTGALDHLPSSLLNFVFRFDFLSLIGACIAIPISAEVMFLTLKKIG